MRLAHWGNRFAGVGQPRLIRPPVATYPDTVVSGEDYLHGGLSSGLGQGQTREERRVARAKTHFEREQLKMRERLLRRYGRYIPPEEILRVARILPPPVEPPPPSPQAVTFTPQPPAPGAPPLPATAVPPGPLTYPPQVELPPATQFPPPPPPPVVVQPPTVPPPPPYIPQGPPPRFIDTDEPPAFVREEAAVQPSRAEPPPRLEPSRDEAPETESPDAPPPFEDDVEPPELHETLPAQNVEPEEVQGFGTFDHLAQEPISTAISLVSSARGLFKKKKKKKKAEAAAPGAAAAPVAPPSVGIPKPVVYGGIAAGLLGLLWLIFGRGRGRR